MLSDLLNRVTEGHDLPGSIERFGTVLVDRTPGLMALEAVEGSRYITSIRSRGSKRQRKQMSSDSRANPLKVVPLLNAFQAAEGNFRGGAALAAR